MTKSRSSGTSDAETVDIEDAKRIQALQDWVRQVLANPVPAGPGVEQRRQRRQPLQATVTLIPLDPTTLSIQTSEKIRAVTKDFVIAEDVAVGGIGIVSDVALGADLYLADGLPDDPVCLLRKARQRAVDDTITEYGFQVIDRFESMGEITGGQ